MTTEHFTQALDRAAAAAQQQQTQQQVPVCYDIGSEGSLRLAYGELKYWTRPAPMLDSLDG